MKQGILSFASKRTTSATVGKTAAKPRKQPTRASSNPETILVSDSSEDELDVQVAKRRRLVATAEQKTRAVSRPDEDEDSEEDEVVQKVEPARERLATSDKRWRKLYGEVRNKMGNIEPVHGKGQTMIDHILRVFDLSYEYGPCVGISRLERWERAHALGLNPPPEVKEILMTKEGSTEEQYTQSVFYADV